jgi:hypothetical protein
LWFRKLPRDGGRERPSDLTALHLRLRPGLLGQGGPVGAQAQVLADLGEDFTHGTGQDVAVDVFVVEPFAGFDDQTVEDFLDGLGVFAFVLGLDDAPDDAFDAGLADIERRLGRHVRFQGPPLRDEFGLQSDGHAHHAGDAGIGQGDIGGDRRLAFRQLSGRLPFDGQGDVEANLGQPAQQPQLIVDQWTRLVFRGVAGIGEG